MVFLVLAAQYESWVVPFAVILAVPFGVFGALSAVWLSGMANDIYFQIGLVTLIGLAAKNAILIVEFANQRYEHGLSLSDAAMEAAKLRFRPIIMTSHGLHSRCGASGDGHGRRGGQPPFHRHRGVRRHAVRHVSGRLLCAVVLRARSKIRFTHGSYTGRHTYKVRIGATKVHDAKNNAASRCGRAREVSAQCLDDTR